MLTSIANKFTQLNQVTLESSMSLVKSFIEFVEYQPVPSKEVEIKEEFLPSCSLSERIICSKRQYPHCSFEETSSSSNKRRQFTSSPISLAPSTSNDKKRKIVDLASNTSESSKRRCMASLAEDFAPKNTPTAASLSSTKVSRKRKEPCGSDGMPSKRRRVNSSFGGSFCNIVVSYADDSLDINKCCAESSSSVHTLPTACSDSE